MMRFEPSAAAEYSHVEFSQPPLPWQPVLDIHAHFWQMSRPA